MGTESTRWFTSTRSGNNGACVEVARLGPDAVGVRDTKDRGAGPVLTFPAATWHAFVDGTKRGAFDRVG